MHYSHNTVNACFENEVILNYYPGFYVASNIDFHVVNADVDIEIIREYMTRAAFILTNEYFISILI